MGPPASRWGKVQRGNILLPAAPPTHPGFQHSPSGPGSATASSSTPKGSSGGWKVQTRPCKPSVRPAWFRLRQPLTHPQGTPSPHRAKSLCSHKRPSKSWQLQLGTLPFQNPQVGPSPRPPIRVAPWSFPHPSGNRPIPAAEQVGGLVQTEGGELRGSLTSSPGQSSLPPPLQTFHDPPSLPGAFCTCQSLSSASMVAAPIAARTHSRVRANMSTHAETLTRARSP